MTIVPADRQLSDDELAVRAYLADGRSAGDRLAGAA
jgi:hypothetical protein